MKNEILIYSIDISIDKSQAITSYDYGILNKTVVFILIEAIIESPKVIQPPRNEFENLIGSLNIDLDTFIDVLALKYGISAIGFVIYCKIEHRQKFLEKFFNIKNFFPDFKNTFLLNNKMTYVACFSSLLILLFIFILYFFGARN